MARRESIKNLQREKNLFGARVAVGTVLCLLMTGLLLYRLSALQIQGSEYYHACQRQSAAGGAGAAGTRPHL